MYGTSSHSLQAYGSLNEGSVFPQDYFTVIDDGYDASKYGYRTFVPASPKTRVFRRSSSSTRRIERFDEFGFTDSTAHMDDYSQCMQSVDPRSLDILSSPEVRAIIESQRDWDDSKADYCFSNLNIQRPSVDDGYLSDSEPMKEGWTSCVSFTDSFEKLPSLDEKKL
jgi:hypothetical protein